MVWLEFDSLVNARDVGGIACDDGGTIRPGQLLRSDNLQSLTEADITQLLELGLTDVVDLRSEIEVEHEGPGPLTRRREVTIHHFTYLPSSDHRPLPADDPADVSGPENASALAENALPWMGKKASVDNDDAIAGHYLSYLSDRPQDVLGALPTIAHSDGACLVHCAAGKDRTGTTVALALLLAGADREAVVDDYAASAERVPLIIDRLMGSPLYRQDLEGQPVSAQITRPESMRAVLDHLDRTAGGPEAALTALGWTAQDTAAMRTKLRGPQQ